MEKNNTKNLGVYAQKGHIPWNKGLTKDDPRVKKYTEKHAQWAKENPQRYWLGKKRPEIGEKISKANKGNVAWNKGLKGYNAGAKSYLWKGGITSKDHVERVKFRNEIQKEILKRDDYTCQICGIRGKNMQVDHIQSWAKYVELRFSMDNCRTLCVECHYQITFGKPMPKEIKGWGQNLFRGGNLQ